MWEIITGGGKMRYSLKSVPAIIFLVLSSQAAWGKTIKVPHDYPTVQKGIDAARTGDIIIVAAGRYNEQIVMREGIILQSDSSGGGDELVAGPGRKKVLRRAQRTIIDGSGYPAHTDASPMVEFPAGITRATILDGFTITKMPEVDHTLPGHAHTIQCRGSSPVVKNNIVIDNGSSGIGSHAKFKDGVTGKRRFSYQNIAHHANTLVENNVFARNIGAGIGNNHYSYATVRNNEVFGNISTHDHPAPGIGIQHGAHPLIEGNLVYDNDWTGIACRKGKQPVNRRTRPIVRGNTVINNGLAGNEKHGAGIGADGVGSAENPATIENNVISGNLAAGIGVREGAFVVLSGNTSYDNDSAGIGIDKSTAHVMGNTVYNNNKSGIGCRGCQATIQNNEIYQNDMAGIGLERAEKMVIVGNRIHDNGTSGLWGRIKNFFSAGPQKGPGVGMRKSEVLIFSANTITNNAVPGLTVTEGSSIRAGQDNVLKKNGSNWAPNLVLRDKSRATLSDTEILEGDTANIFLSSSRLTLNNCRVEGAWKPGIVAEESSTLIIREGSISDNGAIGILLDGSYADIQGAIISGNEHHGLMAQKNSSVKIENCTVSNNAGHGGAGISIDRSEAHLLRNLIHHNDSEGVMVEDGKLVLWNNVLANQVQGADIEGNSLLDARNNAFTDNQAEGLDLSESVKIKHLSHNAFWKNGTTVDRRPNFLNFLPIPDKKRRESDVDVKGNLWKKPGFVDPAAGDYRLKQGSALIDAGEDLGLPYKGAAPDIGAIEH